MQTQHFLSALAVALLLTACGTGVTPPGSRETGSQGLSSTAKVSGPQCAPEECLSMGGFTPPFVEPVVYQRPDLTQGSAVTLTNPLYSVPEDGRCQFGEDGRPTHCKPAASSVALLPDGRIIYFNALEGTENVEFTIFFEAGQVLVTDQTRVLSLGSGEASWLRPDPIDGGAEEENMELLPGLSSGDDGIRNDGGLFCADVQHLADGRILAVGGTNYYLEPAFLGGFGLPELEGLKSSRIFNPATNLWTQSGSMTHGRWYPTLVTLDNGDIFVASGVTKLQKPIYPEQPMQSGRNVPETETYDLGCGTWSENGGPAQRSLPLYPRLHLLPNGQVFYNAAGQAFNPYGQAYDQALWNIIGAYDPVSKSWTDLAYAGLPLRMDQAGLGALTQALNPGNPLAATAVQSILTGLAGSLMSDPTALATQLAGFLSQNPAAVADKINAAIGAGFRGSSFSIMLPLKPDANGEYSKAEFLTAGGVYGLVTAGSPGSYAATALSRVDTVDLSSGEMVYSSRVTAPLNEARWYGTSVLLPNGEVMVFSGANRDEVALPGTGAAIRRAERFDPVTETWTPMATANNPRTYHNTAMLLPDGRVLVGGHAPINTAYGFSFTIPGMSPNDGRDPSLEIYHPPYSFKPRPQISAAPDALAHGSRFTLTTPDAASIESVVLVRNTSLTHIVDGDQRNVELPLLTRDGGALTLAVPANKAVLPPGPYLLFINQRQADGSLVPSLGRQLLVTGADAACT